MMVMNKNAQVCRTKVKYHTEKSAKRAVKALSYEFRTQFDYYRCGDSKHFHLTHKDPEERIGHGNKRKEVYLER